MTLRFLRLSLAILVAIAAGISVRAQPFGKDVLIPISPFTQSYDIPSEDGTGHCCGAYLMASFPVYKNYTNNSSYGLQITGLAGWSGIRSWQVTQAPVGGEFLFTATFCGCCGGYKGCNDCGRFQGCWADLPPWTASIRPRGPLASFTAKASTTTPGLMDFRSTSTEPEGDGLTENWDFGDGGTSTATSVNHRYFLPGPYTVALTVTDTDVLTNRTSRIITIPAPKPEVNLTLLNKHKFNQIEIDEVFDARITVKASDDGVGLLSELYFTTNLLKIPSQFEVLSRSGGTNIGTLQPGEKKEFTWQLKATNSGKFAITTSGVQGKDAIGRVVLGDGDTETGEVTSLIVGVTQIPERLVLGADNNGDGKTNELDNVLQMVIGITNVSKKDVVGVESSNLNDPIQFTSLAESLNVWVTPDVVPSGFFGTIRPGAANAILRTNTYLASDKTYAEARIVLHGKSGDVAVGAAGTGLLNVGGGKLVEARFDIVERPYKAGQPVRVFGSLKNVSRYRDRNGKVIDEGRTVNVLFNPEIQGNGVLGYVVPADYGGRTPAGPVPIQLEADDTMDISAVIATAMVTNQETKLTLNYSALGYVYDDSMKLRRARPGEIEIVEDSEAGWSRQHVVKLEGVQPGSTWEPCSPDLSTLPFLDCRLRDALSTFGGGIKDMAYLAGEGVEVIAVNSLKLAAFEIWLMQMTWDGIEDPVVRRRLEQEVAIDLQALKDFGYESLQGVEVGLESVGPAVHRAIQNTKTNFYEGNYKLIAGNLVQAIGENPDLPFEALAAVRSLKRLMLLREGEESIAKAALRESLERQRVAADVEGYAAKNGGSLDGLDESGLLPNGLEVSDQPRIFRDAMGTSAAEVDVFKRIAQKHRVLIAWRSRAAKSLEYIKAKTHLLKPHGVSIKTVSEIDVKYLGYPEKFLAECVLVEPPIPWIPKDSPQYQNVIDNFLNRFPDLTGSDEASKQLRVQVEERLKFQMGEYPKQITNFKQYLKEGIDANFKAYKQFEPGSLAEQRSKVLLPDRRENFRGAQVDLEVFDDPYAGHPRVSYRLKMEDALGSGSFKPITGDIDIIAILNLDGSVPGLLKRIQIYKELIAEGMQHGESFSFFIDLELRKKFLKCCTPKALGGDGGTMLAATPFGQLLTTQFFDNLSLVEGGPNNALAVGKEKDAFAFLAGVTSAMDKEVPERIGSLDILNTVSRNPAPYVSASALARMVQELNVDVYRDNGTPLRMGPDGEPQVYSSFSDPESPNPQSLGELPALPLRGHAALADATTDALDAELGRLVSLGWQPVRTMDPPGLAGGQWRPVTIEQARNGPAGKGLKIAPYTYITRDLVPGTLELPVLSVSDLGFSPTNQFFAVGDQVVIDPSGPTEEFATLVGVSPFTLNRPLQFLKEAGTTVLFLRGINNAASLPGSLPAQENLLVWLRADAGLTLTNQSVISWQDQSRNGFVFAAPTAATRPAFIPSTNGRPSTVRFDAASAPHLIGNLGRTLTNATIFTLGRFLDTGGGTRYIYSFGTRNFSGLQMTLGRQNSDGAYHFDGAASWLADDTIPGTNFLVFSQVYGGESPDHHHLSVGTKEVLVNRTTVGRPYSAIATNVFLGRYPGLGSFGGELVEWLVYDRALSVKERFEVEGYLRQRAGLSPFVPAASLDLGQTELVQPGQSAGPNAGKLDQGDHVLATHGNTNAVLYLSTFSISNQVVRTHLTSAAGLGAMGVVFGYQETGQFYLFDWRQTNTLHPDWGLAPIGMRLRSIHPPASQGVSLSDLWSGPDDSRVSTWRTNSIPWVADRIYEVEFHAGPQGTTLSVNFGTTNIVTWDINELAGGSGRFGHFAFALPDATFGPTELPGARPIITGFEQTADGRWSLAWANGLPPFVIESMPQALMGNPAWEIVAPATLNQSQVLSLPGDIRFLRIRTSGVVP